MFETYGMPSCTAPYLTLHAAIPRRHKGQCSPNLQAQDLPCLAPLFLFFCLLFSQRISEARGTSLQRRVVRSNRMVWSYLTGPLWETPLGAAELVHRDGQSLLHLCGLLPARRHKYYLEGTITPLPRQIPNTHRSNIHPRHLVSARMYRTHAISDM